METPLEYIKSIIDYIYALLFHYEITGDKELIINTIKSYKKQVGLVLNPYTPVEDIKDFLSYLDIILILGVEPGWSGQEFNEIIISKVNKLAEWKRHNKSYNYQIDVDGGINLRTALLVKDADILTSASFILNSPEPNEMIKKLKFI